MNKKYFCLVLAMMLVFALCNPKISYAAGASISKTKATMEVDSYLTLKISVISDKSTVNWYSNNKSVAAVGKTTGRVTAKSEGIAVISTKFNEKTYKCTITVVNNNVTVKPTPVPKEAKLGPISLTKFTYNIDSAGGVEWNFKIRNNTNKVIKYITMSWYCCNSVGDNIVDAINKKNYVTIKYTGPLGAKETTESKRNSTKFYNPAYDQAKFYFFEIEYTDGTKDTINNNMSSFYGMLPGDKRMPEEVVVSNKFSDGLTWTLYDTGLLEITGAGYMDKEDVYFDAPWGSYSSNIDKVVISEGIMDIPDLCFYECYNLISISIPDSVTKIGDEAFYECSLLKEIELPQTVLEIGDFAFYECNEIDNLIIPSSVEKMSRAFYGWTIDQSVTIKGKTKAPSSWEAGWDSNCGARIVWKP